MGENNNTPSERSVENPSIFEEWIYERDLVLSGSMVTRGGNPKYWKVSPILFLKYVKGHTQMFPNYDEKNPNPWDRMMSMKDEGISRGVGKEGFIEVTQDELEQLRYFLPNVEGDYILYVSEDTNIDKIFVWYNRENYEAITRDKKFVSGRRVGFYTKDSPDKYVLCSDERPSEKSKDILNGKNKLCQK